MKNQSKSLAKNLNFDKKTFLKKNKSRKFIWAEISFFDLWYSKLNEEQKSQIKQLIQERRFVFVEGGLFDLFIIIIIMF